VWRDARISLSWKVDNVVCLLDIRKIEVATIEIEKVGLDGHHLIALRR
jgi:hypothetical protein